MGYSNTETDQMPNIDKVELNEQNEQQLDLPLNVPQTRAERRRAEREAASNARQAKTLNDAARARINKMSALEWKLCPYTFQLTLPPERYAEAQEFLDNEIEGTFIIRWDYDPKDPTNGIPSIGLMLPQDLAAFNERFS